METAELAQQQSQGNTRIYPAEPEPTVCQCGAVMRWNWVDPVQNPITHKPFIWTNKWNSPGEFCKACAERKEFESAEKRKLDEEEKQRRSKEVMDNQITSEMGGGKAKGWNFSTFQPKSDSQKLALEQAKKASDLYTNLYLWGKTTGTGKSHLAGAAYRHARVDLGVLGSYWKPPSLFRYMRVIDSGDQENRLSKCVNDKIIVIDDLGIGNVTDFSIQILYEIVDSRWLAESNGLIITANLSLDELAKKMDDDRLTSRLAGMCKIVEIKGEDRRITK